LAEQIAKVRNRQPSWLAFPIVSHDKEDLMREHAFDTFTRGTTDALSRRHSLMTLGGAALAAGLAGAVGTEAKQNPAKKVKKKNKKKCNQEREECRNLVLALERPPEIEAAFLACCENCFAGDFAVCLIAAIQA
jgi:hypothetical protein